MGPWWYRNLSLIDAGWSQPLNNSGVTDVSGREMSLISRAFLSLKHQSHDKTLYLGHASPASSTQTMLQLPNHWSVYLHILLTFTLSALCPRLPRTPLCRTAIDRRLLRLFCFFSPYQGVNVGVLKLFASTVTGTLTVQTVKTHLTSLFS